MTAKRASVNLWIALLVIFHLAVDSLAINSLASAVLQQKKSRKPPISFEQIESAISQKPSNIVTAKLRDEILAGEIQRRGITFKLNEKVWGCLKDRLHVGPETIRALEGAAKKQGNSSMPHPMMICDKTTILIATFQSLDDPIIKKPISKIIFSQLKDAMRKYSDTVVDSLDEEITVDQGSKVARSKATERGASIIVWGTYSVSKASVLVNVYFEIIQDSRRIITDEKKQIIESLAALDNYSLQIQLSNEMSYLILLILGVARIEADDYKGAIERFTKALDQTSLPKEMVDPSTIYFYRGVAYAEMKEWERSIRDNTKAIEFKANFAEAYSNRGAAYKNRGELQQAIADFTRAIELKANFAVAYYNCGVAYDNKKEWGRAIANYTKAIELKASFAVAYYSRGVAYDNQEELGRAIADYTKAIEFKAGFADAYYNRGLDYRQKGDLERAIADYTKAIEFKADFADAYYNRGWAYDEKSDWEHAVADFTKAIEFKSNYMEAYYNRGLAYEKKGDWERTIDDFTKAIELKPNFAEAYYSCGLAYWDKRELERATSAFTKVIDLQPNNAEAYHIRGLTYKKRGQKANAIYDLKKLLELTSDPALRQAAEKVLKELQEK